MSLWSVLLTWYPVWFKWPSVAGTRQSKCLIFSNNLVMITPATMKLYQNLECFSYPKVKYAIDVTCSIRPWQGSNVGFQHTWKMCKFSIFKGPLADMKFIEFYSHFHCAFCHWKCAQNHDYIAHHTKGCIAKDEEAMSYARITEAQDVLSLVHG